MSRVWLEYSVTKGYLYLQVEGEFTLPEQQENLSVFLDKIKEHGLKRALCDITRIAGLDSDQASTLTRFTLGTNVVASLPLGFRLSILATQKQSESGRFGETVMVNRGGIVKLTTDLNEALEWLVVEQSEKGDPE